MIKIENVVTPNGEQWRQIIAATRNPLNSWGRSDSEYDVKYYIDELDDVPYTIEPISMGYNDYRLLRTLRQAGVSDRKFMRMIPVYMTITANHTWWAEADTYKIGVTRNSCSKMHCIHKIEFVRDQFDHEGIDEVSLKGERTGEILDTVIQELENLRQKFNETKDKAYWRAIIELLPMGYHIKATLFLNYEVLANMYHQRKNHKMQEWRDFTKYLEENMPFSWLITGDKNNA